MLLYHGTCASNIASIMLDGIKPRTTAHGNYPMVPSHEACVYLTRCYPTYYAANAVEDDDEQWHGRTLAIFMVDTKLIDTNNLVPDEDAIAQVTQLHSDMSELDILAAREHVMKHHGNNSNAWRHSLAALGTCAHVGIIPSTAIRGLVTMPMTTYAVHTVRYGFDPTVSVQARRVYGKMYAAYSRWLFDERAQLPTAKAMPIMQFGAHKLPSRTGIEVMWQQGIANEIQRAGSLRGVRANKSNEETIPVVAQNNKRKNTVARKSKVERDTTKC